jgi:TatD DNase family protein
VLVDTHCHLGADQFDTDRAEVVERSRAAGVEHIVVVADSEAATLQAIDLAERFELSATAGVHPHEASTWNADVAAKTEEALSHPKVVAVGETGLDYHYEYSPREAQRTAFAAQLDLGARLGLPVVVHSRSADADMAAMLRDTDATYILHSFSSGADVLDVALAANAYVSFSGMVTFKSWKDMEAVRSVSSDRLLVETDAPYLAPTPHRGKRNEPVFVREVALRVAEIRAQDPHDIEEQTTRNAMECFGTRMHITKRP